MHGVENMAGVISCRTTYSQFTNQHICNLEVAEALADMFEACRRILSGPVGQLTFKLMSGGDNGTTDEPMHVDQIVSPVPKIKIIPTREELLLGRGSRKGIREASESARFATKWKIGKLLPLHKGKGLNPHDPTSYRPISLLPVIGKITERVLQKQILEYMETSGQLNGNHHSYRKKHSTVTAMLQLSDALFTGCDVKKITTLVTLDQSAAFDVIRHDTLCTKLKLYNFSDEVLKWIQSYLNFRSHYVSIGTRQSKFNNITSGVPQGSVLGPILYVLYVNELPELMNDADCNSPAHTKDDKSLLFDDNCDRCGQMPTYADDSTVVIVTKTRFEAQERITLIIVRVKQFLAANALSLNLGKTEIVESMVRQKRVRQQGQPPQLTVQKPDGSIKVITAKDHCRLLGVNFNLDATWKHQLDLGEKSILKSLRSVLGALTHLASNMPVKSRLLIANGLFISRILYLLPMWGGLTRRDAKKVQILINKCARVVLGKRRKTRTRTLMIGCNWLYFVELVKFHSLVQLYKILKFETPKNLRNLFNVTPDCKINLHPARLRIVSESWKWRSARDWNDLPDHLRMSPKLSMFKKTLRRHIIDGRANVVDRRPPDVD